MIKPFLTRFCQKCLSPGRAPINPKFFYDSETDMVVQIKGGIKVYAIDSQEEPPMTKKADIEKSDDQKDRRMWN